MRSREFNRLSRNAEQKEGRIKSVRKSLQQRCPRMLNFRKCYVVVGKIKQSCKFRVERLLGKQNCNFITLEQSMVLSHSAELQIFSFECWVRRQDREKELHNPLYRTESVST